MSILCSLRLHKRRRYAEYPVPAEPGSVTVTNGEDSPIHLEVLRVWTYFHDDRCERCGAKWVNGRRVE